MHRMNRFRSKVINIQSSIRKLNDYSFKLFPSFFISVGSGFLVMAFDVSDDTKPIGTFKLASDGKIIDCLQGVGVNIRKIDTRLD